MSLGSMVGETIEINTQGSPHYFLCRHNQPQSLILPHHSVCCTVSALLSHYRPAHTHPLPNAVYTQGDLFPLPSPQPNPRGGALYHTFEAPPPPCSFTCTHPLSHHRTLLPISDNIKKVEQF
jgi:hypothetical protein